MVHGPIEEGNTVLGSGFCEHVAHVIINGAFADGQSLGNFLVRQPFSDQFDDFKLPCGEGNIHCVCSLATVDRGIVIYLLCILGISAVGDLA